MIEVSAGILRREDGKILLCQRGEGRKNAHLWEFPGGKREKGEDASQCLRRELREELGLEIGDVREYCVREAEGIRFTFLTALTWQNPVLTEHEAAVFVTPRAMLGYPFCPADEGVAREIALSDPPLRHFFWDFDGTLMDTYPGMTGAFLRAARSMGMAAERDRVLALLKESLSHCIGVFAREYGADASELERRYRREEEGAGFEGVHPMPGMRESIEALHRLGGRHYLVTHRNRRAVEMLENCGLKEYFAGFITAEDGFPRKPAPDSLLHLMKKHGLDREACVMIGDRPLDTDAGRNAGMLGCLFDPDRRFPHAPCDLRTEDGAGLKELLCPGQTRGE